MMVIEASSIIMLEVVRELAIRQKDLVDKKAREELHSSQVTSQSQNASKITE